MQDSTATPMKTENLFAALAKAQGAMQNPKKDTVNPFFNSKYADLAAVRDAVQPHLAANGLAFVQFPSADGNKVTVTGKLLHSSGEWMESSITGTARDGSPQALGSCITYLRRYQLSAMMGIAAEADDDGNAASRPAKKERTAAQERPTFAGGVPFEEHLAQQAAKEAAPQADAGDFLDYIKSVRIKSQGTKNNKPWTLYEIETEGHGNFSTFSDTVFEDAQLAITDAVKVLISTEPTPKGPKINSIEWVTYGQESAQVKA